MNISKTDIKAMQAIFDADFYLEQNADVAAANVNPFKHYMQHGWREGRDPSPYFSTSYYLDTNTDIRDAGLNPFQHFMKHGWREWRDPSPRFSTEYYLKTYPDIREADVNPLQHYIQHGRREGREPASYRALRVANYQPRVSVIIPNYNHARFLEQRIQSILAQTYKNIELFILDDCSTDESIDVIEKCISGVDIRIVKAYNETNSGNVFEQWRKGFGLATGELVWICESDDFADPDFLKRLVPHFADRGVMIAFGRIQFANADGDFQPGMDTFRERAESGIWGSALVRPAAQWFAKALSTVNVIANVGGCLIRNQPVAAEHWASAKKYRIAGDWYLYSRLSNGGKIAYEPLAVSYFRQHGKNTSASNFRELYYFQEHQDIIVNNCDIWDVPFETQKRFAEQVVEQWYRLQMHLQYGSCKDAFPDIFNFRKSRTKKHILIGFLGFLPGGGELFPIHVSNGLAKAGETTSIIAWSMAEINDDMFSRLDPRIAVYDRSELSNGVDVFLENTGISVVNSHSVSIDMFFFGDHSGSKSLPYVVTLHGSHDVCGFDINPLVNRMAKGVRHWIYTADKNLGVLSSVPLYLSALSKLPNAMPRDERESPFDRERLGIAPDAVVYTFVARGIEQKGWRASIEAFVKLRALEPERDAHLILVGSGSRADDMRSKYGERRDISFLGYQSEINGLYRISDCAIVPTRFEGESYPLCLIQAVQEGLPIIATEIAEIPSMLSLEGDVGGVLIPRIRDTKKFIGELANAMRKMFDPDVRRHFGALSERLGTKFDMDRLVQNYVEIYDEAIASVTRQTQRPAA